MRPTRLALCSATLAALTSLIAPHPAEAAAPRVEFTKIHFDGPGPDRGGNKSLNGEYVVIKNTTRKAIDLEGWTLTDAARFKYTFAAVTLKAGKQVTIRSGQGKDTTTLYWNRKWYVWNNDKDTATLRDDRGRRVDVCSWKVTPRTSKGYTPCR
jgi:hypothetical protein